MKIAVISIFSLLVLISAVSANGVDLTLSSNRIVGYGGETSSVDLIIKNNELGADTFTITVFPSTFDKVTTNLEKFSVWINTSSTEKVKLYFDMPMDVDEMKMAFKIYVKSVTDSSISDEKELVLQSVRRTDVYIDRIIQPKDNQFDPEQSVDIQVRIRNVGLKLSEKYELETTITKPDSSEKKYIDVIESILPKTDETITNTYEIGKSSVLFYRPI